MSGKLNASQVFDAQKPAKYEAISAIMGGQHGMDFNNLRFYYDPFTTKLQPIGYDSNSGAYIDDVFLDDTLYPYNDTTFMASYAHELEIVSQPSYADKLFKDIEPELQSNISILHKENPLYHYSSDYITYNQNFIRKKLNPVEGFNAYYYNSSPTNGSLTLELGNVQELPIEILNATYYNGTTVFEPKGGSCILNSRMISDPINYDKVEFTMPAGFNWSDGDASGIIVNYRLLGTTTLRNESIMPWQRISDDFNSGDLLPDGLAQCG